MKLVWVMNNFFAPRRFLATRLVGNVASIGRRVAFTSMSLAFAALGCSGETGPGGGQDGASVGGSGTDGGSSSSGGGLNVPQQPGGSGAGAGTCTTDPT